jgi:hypothetical protein
MAASLLENGGARNTTPPETQSTKENQAESKLIQSALFQQARRFDGTEFQIRSPRQVFKLILLELLCAV